MKNLPEELTITEEDLEGEYGNNVDCPLARALKRAGVPINDDDGYTVGGTRIVNHGPDGSEPVGFYKWDNGEAFRPGTLREGRLVRS